MSVLAPAYVPRYFKLEEYLPPTLFERLRKAKALWKGWYLLDERLLRTDDALREEFGPLVLNDWHLGGTRDECGLRLPGMPHFKETSQHAYGRASDKASRQWSGGEMRQRILEKPDKFPLLMAMEIGVSWLHTDHRNCKRIALVRPT